MTVLVSVPNGTQYLSVHGTKDLVCPPIRSVRYQYDISIAGLSSQAW